MATGTGVIERVVLPAVNFAAVALGYIDVRQGYVGRSNRVEIVADHGAITWLPRS